MSLIFNQKTKTGMGNENTDLGDEGAESLGTSRMRSTIYSSRVKFCSKNKFRTHQETFKNISTRDQTIGLRNRHKFYSKMTSLGKVLSIKSEVLSTDVSSEADELKSDESGIALRVSEKIKKIDFSNKKKVFLKDVKQFASSENLTRKHISNKNMMFSGKKARVGEKRGKSFYMDQKEQQEVEQSLKRTNKLEGVRGPQRRSIFSTKTAANRARYIPEELEFSDMSFSDGSRADEFEDWEIDADYELNNSECEKVETMRKIQENLSILASFCGQSELGSPQKSKNISYFEQFSQRTKTVISRIESRNSPVKKQSKKMIDKDSNDSSNQEILLELGDKKRGRNVIQSDNWSRRSTDRLKDSIGQSWYGRIHKGHSKARKSKFGPAAISDAQEIKLFSEKFIKNNSKPLTQKPEITRTFSPVNIKRTNIYKNYKPLITKKSVNLKRCFLLEIEKDSMKSSFSKSPINKRRRMI